MAIYGYARVSTTGQDLSNQLDRLKAEGCTVVYSEKYTGTNRNRKELKGLLDVVKDGDTVKVTKLDRLARSLQDLQKTVQDLNGRGVAVVFLDNGLTFLPGIGNPMQNLMLNMLGAVAEFEASIITERMREGKQYAKETKPDYKEGRPKRMLTDRHLHALSLLKDKTYKDVSKVTDYSTATIIRIRKQYIDEVAAGKRKDTLGLVQ